ncbi:MAG: catalase [Gammaproteobacteria bacterium]|nr:catalase [Gammaproteobacteria bacterium]
MAVKSKNTQRTVASTKKLKSHKITIGNGNELHQSTEDQTQTLTTQQGTPVADDQNSLRLGAAGPGLLEDFHFREKIFHFDHERIPERVVHARGFGVHGFFENYDSLADITKADLFQRKNEKTPAFVRFSTVAGNKGSFDLARDVRGFAVKLYTQQGNWDLVGNNMPVFFIQDAIKFPDLIHAAKQEPNSGFPQAQTAHDNFWDFISLMPESMHMIMWIMSDRAIPRGFRFMEGFGVHTFRMINAKGKSTFVKFHWKPKLGMQSVVWNEAVKINGADPDFHRRDLWNAIQTGNFPEWELGLQLFDDKFAARFPFDVLDATKIIPEEDLPIRKVGRLVLNRCVDNFFAETEQVAFCTQHIVPGIDFSNDPLLQGRNFSYLDTQLKRLGSPNFASLPINAPKCPRHLFQQDGHMAFHNPVGRVNYEPNSLSEHGGPRENPEIGFHSFPEKISAEKCRIRSNSFGDHYSQARQFYISQIAIEQHHIAKALIFELSKVEKILIRQRMVGHLLHIDADLANEVKNGLRLIGPITPPPIKQPVKRLKPSKALSIILNNPLQFMGRKIGIFLSDGANADFYSAFTNQLEKDKIQFEIIAPAVGGVKLNNSQFINAHHNIQGGPSVLFDAIVLLVSQKVLQQLLNEPTLRDFISDAFNHFKFIGYVTEALPLMEKAGISQIDDGCILIQDKKSLKQFLNKCKNLRFWQREETLYGLQHN